MTPQDFLQMAAENEDRVVVLDGFDDAVVGLGHHWCAAAAGGGTRENALVYDYHRMVATLMSRDGIGYDEACEFLECNTLGGYFGTGTPIDVNLSNELGVSLPDDDDVA